jgi:predicted acetyltransferase
MPLDVRPYPVDADYRPFSEAVARGFSEGATEADIRDWERLSERDRLHAAYDGERVVGGAGAFTFKLTVPGGTVGAAGVTAVAVAPTHRRRGLLRELMRQQIDDVRARGEPVAILWASEGSIYQRFGYGLATLSARFEIERARTTYRYPVDAAGQIRYVDAEEASRLFPPVYDALRAEWPGFFDRTPAWWEIEVLGDPERHRGGAGPKFYAVYEADGRPEGYLIYRVRHEWDFRGSKSILEVRELIPTSFRAMRDLWRFVFDVDLMHTIRAERLQSDHPLLLMLAEPRRLGLTLSDALWLRLVDLPAALSSRSFHGEGAVVFDVRDEFCPWNAGRLRLEVGGGRGEARSDGRKEADIAVDVTDLAAAYLGAFTFRDLLDAGRISEQKPGAVGRADALFQVDRRPWCPQVF